MLLIIECNLGYCVFFIECSLGYYCYNCNELYDGCLSDACDSEFGICINTSGCHPGCQPGNNKYDLGIVESNKCMHELAYIVHKKMNTVWTRVMNKCSK